MRTIEQTAVLIVLLVTKAGLSRARLSNQTILRLSKRRLLRSAFLGRLTAELDDFGYKLMEIEGGGFGIISIKALEGAKMITAKRYLQDELDQLRKCAKEEDEEEYFRKLKVELEEASHAEHSSLDEA